MTTGTVIRRVAIWTPLAITPKRVFLPINDARARFDAWLAVVWESGIRVCMLAGWDCRGLKPRAKFFYPRTALVCFSPQLACKAANNTPRRSLDRTLIASPTDQSTLDPRQTGLFRPRQGQVP